MPARATKYKPETVGLICAAIEKGMTLELAASYAHVSRVAVWMWKKDHPEFAQAIEEAEARAVAHWLDQIERAAFDGNWQAAAWRLERRYPDLYGLPKVKHEVSGPNGGSIPVEFTARTALAEIASGSEADR